MFKRYWKEIIIGFATGILNGLFGAGGGSVVVPAMEKFLGVEEKAAHATAILVILMMSVVSAFIYVREGFFDLRLWMWVSIGGVLGGLIGAKLLKKIPKKWLKVGFGVVIVVTAVKMVF